MFTYLWFFSLWRLCVNMVNYYCYYYYCFPHQAYIWTGGGSAAWLTWCWSHLGSVRCCLAVLILCCSLTLKICIITLFFNVSWNSDDDISPDDEGLSPTAVPQRSDGGFFGDGNAGVFIVTVVPTVHRPERCLAPPPSCRPGMSILGSSLI